MKRPTELYPTIKLGFIKADAVRFESIDGSEMYCPLPAGYMWMRNYKPVEWNGKIWFLSHLQKRASVFIALYKPWIFHFLVMWRLQKRDKTGRYIPNSEQGIYFRTPGWRWQVPDKNSEGTPWIWSRGRVPGTHLD